MPNVWRGAWSAAYAIAPGYVQGDEVSSGGLQWACASTGTTSQPGVDTTWLALRSGGASATAAADTIDPTNPRLLYPGGESVYDRVAIAGWGWTGDWQYNGLMTVTYFTALRTETIRWLTMRFGTASVGWTTGLIRAGIYAANPDGSGQLVAAIPSDPTIGAVANSTVKRQLTTPWQKVAGRRYGWGWLTVGTDGSTPQPPAPAALRIYFDKNAVGIVQPVEVSLYGAPSGSGGSLTDLPATLAPASPPGYGFDAYQLEMTPT